MSTLASQFATMIRELYTMLCEQCGKRTAHRLTVEGRVEVYTCETCGARKEYTVR